MLFFNSRQLHFSMTYNQQLLPPPPHPAQYSEAAVEQDMLYMSQPSRIYIGDNVNVFGRGEGSEVVG